MPTTTIFRNFQQADFSRNQFLRGSVHSIWDANLHYGDVRPFACPELICENTTPFKKLKPLSDCPCLGLTDCSNTIKGFCHNQHFNIQFGHLVQSTTPALCTTNSRCLAGAPFSNEPPSVSSNCDVTCDAVGVSYVITYVTTHAGIEVESAPSPASQVVAIGGHIPNTLVLPPQNTPNGYCITETRLYRTESTFEDGTDSIPAEGAEFLLVTTFPGVWSGQPFVDTVPTSETGHPLMTYEPMAFPAPNNLVDVARTDDGIVVADKHRVYISETGQPQFTWDGVVEIEDEIKAVRAIGNVVFVFTNNHPVKITYRHTDGIISVDREIIYRKLPLCSVCSLSVYGDDIYFASTHSLYRWGTGSKIVSVLTSVLTPEQWKNICCESVTGTAYEFGYIFSSDNMDYSLMVEFGGDGTDTRSQTHVMPISYINANAFGLDNDGHIYYQEKGKIYKWDWRRDECGCDDSRNFQIDDHIIPPVCERCDCCPWKIKLYVDNEGKNRFSKMRVEFDERSGPITLAFYLKHFGKEQKIAEGIQIISSRGFSLPKYCSSQTFCAELTGCDIMHEVRFATSMQELVNSSNNQVET